MSVALAEGVARASIVPLSEVADLIRGVSYPKADAREEPATGFVPVLRATNIQDAKLVLDSDLIFVADRNVSPDQRLRQGDIVVATSSGSKHLVGKSGQLHRAWLGSFGAFCATVRPRPGIHPRYLALFLQSPAYWHQIGKKALGVNINNLRRGDLESLELPLPPVADQARIVAEIEKQFSRLDEAVANLKRVKANLRHYGSATLRAAFAGELVPREAALAQQQRRPFECGGELLARVTSNRNGRKPKALSLPRTSIDEPALEGWTWTTLGECFKVTVGATPSRKEPAYWGGSVPWVSSGEVQFSRISRTNEFITQAGLANSSTQINPASSVLLGMIGQGRTRGQAAILDIAAANNQNCAAIWVSRTPVPPEFVYYWLMSRYERTRSEGSGNNQQALNKSLVESIPLPLPPLAEQHRIVAEVDRRLSLIREVEAEVDVNLKRAQRLRQTILAKSFSM